MDQAAVGAQVSRRRHIKMPPRDADRRRHFLFLARAVVRARAMRHQIVEKSQRFECMCSDARDKFFRRAKCACARAAMCARDAKNRVTIFVSRWFLSAIFLAPERSS
jgi:hypothetical protein